MVKRIIPKSWRRIRLGERLPNGYKIYSPYTGGFTKGGYIGRHEIRGLIRIKPK